MAEAGGKYLTKREAFEDIVKIGDISEELFDEKIEPKLKRIVDYLEMNRYNREMNRYDDMPPDELAVLLDHITGLDKGLSERVWWTEGTATEGALDVVKANPVFKQPDPVFKEIKHIENDAVQFIQLQNKLSQLEERAISHPDFGKRIEGEIAQIQDMVGALSRKLTDSEDRLHIQFREEARKKIAIAEEIDAIAKMNAEEDELRRKDEEDRKQNEEQRFEEERVIEKEIREGQQIAAQIGILREKLAVLEGGKEHPDYQGMVDLGRGLKHRLAVINKSTGASIPSPPHISKTPPSGSPVGTGAAILQAFGLGSLVGVKQKQEPAVRHTEFRRVYAATTSRKIYVEEILPALRKQWNSLITQFGTKKFEKATIADLMYLRLVYPDPRYIPEKPPLDPPSKAFAKFVEDISEPILELLQKEGGELYDRLFVGDGVLLKKLQLILSTIHSRFEGGKRVNKDKSIKELISEMTFAEFERIINFSDEEFKEWQRETSGLGKDTPDRLLSGGTKEDEVITGQAEKLKEAEEEAKRKAEEEVAEALRVAEEEAAALLAAALGDTNPAAVVVPVADPLGASRLGDEPQSIPNNLLTAIKFSDYGVFVHNNYSKYKNIINRKEHYNPFNQSNNIKRRLEIADRKFFVNNTEPQLKFALHLRTIIV